MVRASGRTTMHRSRHTWILLAVATLVVGLAAPATAKKGGSPGAPSGTGLEVTVASSAFMWANSDGDEILYDITVSNTSGDRLDDIAVLFVKEGQPDVDLLEEEETPLDLEKNGSWTTVFVYTVDGPFVGGEFTGDLADLPPSQSQVTVGTVKAEVVGGPSDSAPVEMTAAPIPPCGEDLGVNDPFSFTTNDDYSVCAFKGSGSWATTTELNRPSRGKSHSPSATIRDGVPGNWCNTDDDLVVGESGIIVTSYWFFPLNGTCLNGGAGGDEIPVRNTDTFYLATWRGNVVEACPGVSPDDVCPPSNGE